MELRASDNRNREIRRVIILEGLANTVILIVKVIIGISTGSLAILADAIHSLTDVVNNVFAWIVIRISSKPPDEEHPYGHRKFETLAVFFLATLLTVLALELCLYAFRKTDSPATTSTIELTLMVSVLIVNITLSIWQGFKAKQFKSDILFADSTHTFADALTTVVVIVGWQLSAAGYVIFDKLCALGVAGLVFYLAFTLFQKAAPVLVDHSAIPPERLHHCAMTVRGVRKVSRVRSRSISDLVFVDMIIHVDKNLTTEESHNIADKIEVELKEKFNVNDCSIHVEPVN